MDIEQQGALFLYILFEFRDNGIGQNCAQLYLIRIVFKPIILKFKIFIYNSDIKIIYNFCIDGNNTLPVRGGEQHPRGRNFLPLVFSERTPQNTQN